MHVGAAEILRRHHLARRRFHQRRPAEKDRALLAHDDGFVRHRRNVSAARGAGAHHDGNLRDALRRQGRLIVEDAAEMIAVGKHFGPVRQVGAAAIDEIDARQPVLARDLLRADMLLHRHRIISAALDRGVVAHDHAFAALDAADAGDDAGGMDRVLVHAEGRETGKFQKRRARIDQRHHAVARQQFTAPGVALARFLVAAERGRGAARGQIVAQRAPLRGIRGEFLRGGIDGQFNPRQGALPIPFGRKLWPGFPRKKTPQIDKRKSELREEPRGVAHPSGFTIRCRRHSTFGGTREEDHEKIIADFRRRVADRGTGIRAKRCKAAHRPAPAAQQSAPAEKMRPRPNPHREPASPMPRKCRSALRAQPTSKGPRQSQETTGQGSRETHRSGRAERQSSGPRRDAEGRVTGQQTRRKQASELHQVGTTGQGAASTSASLTGEQRSKISASIKQQNAPRVNERELHYLDRYRHPARHAARAAAGRRSSRSIRPGAAMNSSWSTTRS